MNCPKCNGTGKIAGFSHIQNGDCFACGATGKIDIKTQIGENSDVMLEVFLKQDGSFGYALLTNRTWTNYISGEGQRIHEWGRDRWQVEINDVEYARKLWKDPNIKHGIS